MSQFGFFGSKPQSCRLCGWLGDAEAENPEKMSESGCHDGTDAEVAQVSARVVDSSSFEFTRRLSLHGHSTAHAAFDDATFASHFCRTSSPNFVSLSAPNFVSPSAAASGVVGRTTNQC